MRKNSSGFTIIELMIATATFSVVVLVVTTGIIRITQTYYKNLALNKTQEVVRTTGDDIAGAIQLANAQKRVGINANQFCIGDVRYTYVLNSKVAVGSTAVGLRADRITPSTPCAVAGAPGRELLSNNMRLLHFDVSPVDTLNKTWRVQVSVAYGDDDLLTSYDNASAPVGWSAVTDPAVRNATCKSGVSGGSFCATSKLDTLAKRRLN